MVANVEPMEVERWGSTAHIREGLERRCRQLTRRGAVPSLDRQVPYRSIGPQLGQTRPSHIASPSSASRACQGLKHRRPEFATAIGKVAYSTGHLVPDDQRPGEARVRPIRLYAISYTLGLDARGPSR